MAGVTSPRGGGAVKTDVWQRIDALSNDLWDLALRIHANPELGFQEEKAVAWLTETLERGGFRVERGVGGLPTAFRAVHPAEKPGPRIAILAEYDALPELGHACGHNLIASIAVGAALGLAPFKEKLPGTLFVIGTPAEEGGGGKIKLIQAGVFKNIDAAMMVHPSDQTVVDRGSLAITEVKIEFHGKAAHASSEPEKGINALDAVIQTFVGLNALRQHIKDGARIHGIITHGGVKPNIVPEYAAALFYVRAAENSYRDELVGKLRRCAEGAALATGASLTFTKVGHEYKAIRPNKTMAQVFAKYLRELGYPPEEPQGWMGSTDMGDVSWEVPAIHPYIRIGVGEIPGHSREFAAAAKSEGARQAMIAAAKALAATCIELWTDPEVFQKVQAEFRQGRGS
ncbi:MAG: M20 family metallopeptidase [Candidatus Bipolaricaulota bacterium]|nr:M20 family metallopeptidase [Candidatus Bipolaricaulota bacterium]MDW8126251.1 M20 family metallopeptidase [Candidatus Bipolaricaulota bacterium]